MTFSKLIGLPEVFSEHGGSVDNLIVVLHYFMIALFVGWTAWFLLCCYKF